MIDTKHRRTDDEINNLILEWKYGVNWKAKLTYRRNRSAVQEKRRLKRLEKLLHETQIYWSLYLKTHPRPSPDGLPDSPQLKQRARTLANSAKHHKKIKLRPCEVCSSITTIEMHHDDYRYPLRVTFFCRRHHARHHRMMRLLSICE